MKNKFKGTPGPWQVSDFDDSWKDIVEDSEGRFVAVIHDELSEKGGQEVAEASARLIAAAPEMLEALQEMVEVWESGLTKSIPAMNQEPAYRKAKQIIRKALGE